ncbi:MAG TPA: class I SAM-dependent methyltransferase [Anaerolineae bacterium]|nr:class I SAM-dependent methyltransferase [Anaerolineae bacterium]
MATMSEQQAQYSNWVSSKFIIVPAFLSILFGGLAFIIPALGFLGGFFFVCAIYFAYARRQFSPKGGDIQTKVQNLLLQRMEDWDGKGKVLDIGCGNGPLSIRIAKRFPTSEIIGIDTWGTAWEFSMAVCKRNAIVENVDDRVRFQHGSAASLPFDGETFDMVVSNLVFHEVRNVRDKSKLIQEALRVIKPGGRFVFQDLFLWKLVYGDADDLLERIWSWGIESVTLLDTSSSDFIPKALKLPFMLGTVGILYGRK